MNSNNTRSSAHSAIAAVVLFGLLAFASTNAYATPLGLTSTHPGDVTTHFTDVEYTLNSNPATGTLTANGFPDEFDVNAQGFVSSSFSLTLTVARSTGAPLGGTVSITGDTDGTPNYNGDLLEGTITQFGFHNPPIGTPGVGNIFEFVVHVTGGLLAAPYYSSNTAGIIMNIANGSASPSFTGVFTAPFHNDGIQGFSDTFPMLPPPSTSVPEPTSFLVWGLALIAGFSGRRALRRDRSNSA
jgi:hypothetical protein